MIKKYRFLIIFILTEIVLAFTNWVDFIRDDSVLLTILTALFLVVMPIIYYFLTRKNSGEFAFWFVFYAIFRITPYVFSMEGNFFEVIFHWKIYLNVMFVLMLIWNLRLFLKRFRDNLKKLKNEESDDLTLISTAVQNAVGFKKLGKILSFEVCSFYYCFFKWRQPANDNTLFSGYKNSGVIALFVSLMFLSIVEATIFHIFLIAEHKIIALLFAFSHIYLLINLVGHLKALIFRKHFISPQKILIRYGLFDTLEIPVEFIVKINKFYGNYERSENVVKFALLAKLEPHNVSIELRDNVNVYFPFGIVKSPSKILLYLDEPSKILGLINNIAT